MRDAAQTSRPVEDTTLGAVPPVLMYHSVARYRDDPYLLTVTPDRFAGQLRVLRRMGLRGVSMRELLRARAVGRARGLVGLTFDDGYADFADQVLPLLRRFHCTATVFVLAGRFGGSNEWDADGDRKPLMTADQVRLAGAAGMEIGSHGLRHLRLTEVDADTLAAEVRASRTILREVSGQRVGGFCYPYGLHDDTVLDAVQLAGYDYGCAVSWSELLGQYAVPRTFVGDRDRAIRLAAKWGRHQWRALRGRALRAAAVR